MTRHIGSKHGMAKIDERDVVQIKELLAHREKLRADLAALTMQKIGEKFDVSSATVKNIATGRNWSHV